MKKYIKPMILAGLLLLCLSLSGCYIPPDEISDQTTNLTVGGQSLPFQSIAPLNTVTPTPVRQQQVFDTVPPQVTAAPNPGNDLITVITVPPTATPNWNTDWGTDIGESQATSTPVTNPFLGGNVGWENNSDGQQASATPTPRWQIQGTTEPATMQPITIATPTPTPRSTATPKPTKTPKPTSNSLKVGSEGKSVKNLQQRLKDLGYYKGSVDGVFGTGTEEAVKAFQQTNKLTVDGKAGSNTLNRLYSSNAIRKPAPTATKAPKPTAKPTPKATKTPRPTATPNLSRPKYLTEGSSGKDVRQMQTRLIQLGWLGGKADGEYSGSTKAAVKAFQKKCGLWDDGIAGPDTLAKLYSDSAPKASNPVSSVGESLRPGAEGDEVRALQKRLKKLGYYTGSADGSYGAGTQAAVEAFQRNNGLKADGIAGSATLNALYDDDAVKYNGTTDKEENSSSGSTKKPSSATTPKPSSQVSSTGYTTLREGDDSGAVKTLQTKLTELGYYNGKKDGSYGSGTKAAVVAFQSANHLTADGVAGPATQRLMYGTSSKITYNTLRPGDEGNAVTNLQYTLYELGYYDGKINGIYSDTLSDAVRAFQINNKLEADGVAGNKTLQAMYSDKAISATAVTYNFETLRRGDKGNDVVEMQDRLRELGYLTTITGEYDRATEKAVSAFQRRNGLVEDGVAGKTTLTVLYYGNVKRAE